MEKSTRKPSKIGEVLEHFFNQAGLQQKFQEQKILNAWKETVGEAIAERTQPIRIQNGVLYVKVTNSVWMQELQFMKGLIREKIQEQSGNKFLIDLHFFMGEIDFPEAGMREKKKTGREQPMRDLSRDERERIDKELAGMQDLELRKILASFFSNGLRAKNPEEE